MTCGVSSRPSSSSSSSGSVSACPNRTRARLLAAMTLCVIGFGGGCGGTRTVFVEPGAPIRMGPDVRGRVYYLDGSTGAWTLTDRAVRIPEGWYSVSPEDGDGAAAGK